MQNRREEWEELGDAIQEIIDSAVNSRNYQKLNQTVTQTVNRMADVGEEVGRKVADIASQAAYRGAAKANKNIYSSKLGSYSQPHRPVRSSQQYRPQPQPARNLPVLYQSTSGKMAVSIVKTVFGGVITFGSVMSLAASAILNALAAGSVLITVGMGFGLAFLGGGAVLLGNGIRSITRLNRFEKYVRALGIKTHIPLEQLARIVGKPVKFVRKELPGMIQEGLFLEGHLDSEGTSLITSNETYHHYQETAKRLEEQKQRELLEEKSKPAAPKITSQVQEVLDKGNAFIRQIRTCNDAIPGEEISAKIFRMENIVQKIFDRAEAHPEIVPDLKKMMDYYLPMTVKLLQAYADMDAQPIQGETIQNSKREIEGTLDTLNQAFEKLLDSVFRETAMDVSSDISVLQAMLAQEGLTEDELDKLRKEKNIL